MKKTVKLFGNLLVIAFAAVMIFAITSCGDGGDTPASAIYTGIDDSGAEYKLEINAAGRAAYSPKVGDSYTLTVTPAGGTAKKSTGTVSGVNPLKLKPSNSSVTFTITVNASGGITAMSGTITYADGTTQAAPTVLTPPTPDGSGGDPSVWTLADFDMSFSMNAITYGNGKFVVGSDNGGMKFSTDGTTWHAMADSKFGSTDINAIAYGNNKFVAGGGDNGKMARSENGITWTVISKSVYVEINFDINAIAYGNGIFVAGGGDSVYIATSEDGAVTWHLKKDEVYGKIKAIAYGNGKFVAGGDNGKMAYSTDGKTWTAVADSKFGSTGINAIAYGNNKFVAVGMRGKMAYSSDGITWTAVSDSTFGTSGINAIAYGNGNFVAGGDDNGGMAYSTDGTTWTAVGDSPFGKALSINAIAYGNNKFVAVSEVSIAYSN